MLLRYPGPIVADIGSVIQYNFNFNGKRTLFLYRQYKISDDSNQNSYTTYANRYICLIVFLVLQPIVVVFLQPSIGL